MPRKGQVLLAKHERICIGCNKTFMSKTKTKMYCDTPHCYTAFHMSKRHTGKILGIDYIECPVCQQRVAEITVLHAQMHGFTTPIALKNQYGLPSVKCQNLRDSFVGENNPGYGHGGILSPWSTLSGKSLTEIQQSKDKATKNRKGKGNTNVQFFLNKGMTQEEAEAALYKRQSNGLVKMIEMYGEEEGRQRWLNRQVKWLESLKKSGMFNGTSKASDKLFSVVNESFNNLLFGKENEVVIELEKHTCKVDCYNPDNKKIIEFYGDYWHGNPTLYKAEEYIQKRILVKDRWEHDRERIEGLKEKGYEVLIVWESEYNVNPNNTIEKCIYFLR